MMNAEMNEFNKFNRIQPNSNVIKLKYLRIFKDINVEIINI